MSAINIFQIYYSAATRAMLDPGFIPLDNSANERPDWREYWPIRNYLRANPPVPHDYYGFLSPAFGSKTRLGSKTVLDFVRAHQGDADVILFSPYFDQGAFFLNQWEQGAMIHPAAAATFEAALALVAPGFGIRSTATTSRNTVFCNYFVARGDFFRAWLERCERLFESAERADSDLGRGLSQEAEYVVRAPVKVFVLERVATALLATESWKTKAFNPLLLPLSGSRISALGAELASLDALKIAYLEQGYEQYKQAFFALRARYAELNAKR
jgi:hypothetical protein